MSNSFLSVEEKLDSIEKSGWEIAWDGCHKIYFLQDEDRVKEAKKNEYDIYPSLRVKEIYENSCSLKFVSRWGYDNDDFDHKWNIDQGEGE